MEKESIEFAKWLKHLDNGNEHYNPFTKVTSESIGFSPHDCFHDDIMTVEQLFEKFTLLHNVPTIATDNTSTPSESEDKGEVPWELKIIKNIWRRAYLDSEEDHVIILKEYAGVKNKDSWNDAIETAINTVLLCVGNRGEGKEAIDELTKLKK